MSSPLHQPGREAIQDFLDWSPRPVDIAHVLDEPAADRQKNAFYDRHISPDLVLRQIKVDPDLLTSFAAEIDAVLDASVNITPWDLQSPALTLKQGEVGYRRSRDALSIALWYSNTVAIWCRNITSHLVIHPEQPSWLGDVLYWRMSLEGHAPTDAMLEWRDPDHDFGDPAWAATDPGMRELIDAARQHTHTLIIWHFRGPRSGERLINLEFDLSSLGSFPFCWTAAAGPPARALLSCPPLPLQDAPAPIGIDRSTLGGFANLGSIKGSTGKGRSQYEPGDDDEYTLSAQHSHLPLRHLQQCWAAAVKLDATYIVLSCGIFERIGVRHRSSGTLVLSAPYLPSDCKTPKYGRIHAGLYVAAIRDSLARAAIVPPELPARPIKTHPATRKA